LLQNLGAHGWRPRLRITQVIGYRGWGIGRQGANIALAFGTQESLRTPHTLAFSKSRNPLHDKGPTLGRGVR